MTEYINWNGKIVEKDVFHISPDNRSFRYGDGFFETMKVVDGNILLAAFHITRFFSSLQLLSFDVPALFTPEYITSQVQNLVIKNKHSSFARVRLMVYRGNGGLYDPENLHPNFVIQSWPLEKTSKELNTNGLNIDIYTEARKTSDSFSMVKSNNYLGYAMAALWAKKNKLNDCLLLNAYDDICDSTVANIFIVENNIIKTPAVAEGCINGVARAYLIECCKKDDIAIMETTISAQDVLNASEVFLTNAIAGIKWVKQLGECRFNSPSVALQLHNDYMKNRR
ncbi:aminotransferase class IV [Segetibacter koreensis]|uniref:aminotransferase class IV n=1 Tax=Segetibacter koreensis TaxID=398037 RepID=UPI00037BFF3B|nr:aminotransferase class IV [Segetibacter koreensis]